MVAILPAVQFQQLHFAVAQMLAAQMHDVLVLARCVLPTSQPPGSAGFLFQALEEVFLEASYPFIESFAGNTQVPGRERGILAVVFPEDDPFEPVYSLRLRNPNSGNVIPLEDRYVQWMPAGLARFLTPSETRTLVAAIRKAERHLPKVQLNPKNETDLQDLSAPQYSELIAKFARGAKTPAARITADSIQNSSLILRRQFEEAYYDVHSVSIGLTSTHALVFQVGRGGGIALGIPILADITAEEAKKLALYVGIFGEVILLIGRLLGVPMSTQKAADAIADALKNSRVLQALLKFINRLKADVTDIIGALYELLFTLHELEALGAILGAAIIGGLGLLGLLWLILQVLSFLIPGLGPAVKVAEVLDVSVALYAKVKLL